eukprot:10283330-Alexandrium_andersonii.AAC.1
MQAPPERCLPDPSSKGSSKEKAVKAERKRKSSATTRPQPDTEAAPVSGAAKSDAGSSEVVAVRGEIVADSPRTTVLATTREEGT